MKLPRIRHPDRLKKNTQVAFGGYNALGTEGELCAMENLTSDYAPELASRPKRKISSRMNMGLDSFAAGTYLYRYGGSFLLYSEDGQTFTSVTTPWHIGSDEMDHGSIPEELRTPRRRLIAELAGQTVVWPERDAADLSTRTVSYINLRHTGVNACLVSVAGERSGRANAARIPAVIPQDQWEEKNLGFRVGDAVTFSGAVIYPENNVTAVVRELRGLHEVRDLHDPTWVSWFMLFDDDTFRLPNHLQLTLSSSITAGDYYADIGCEDAGLWLQGLPAMASGQRLYVKFRPGTGDAYSFADVDEIRLGATGEPVRFESAEPGLTAETLGQDPILMNGDVGVLPFTSRRIRENVGQYAWWESVTVERQAPMLDVLFAHENRLFGARGDTIYVSKWGDPYNWNVFEGLASDSFTTDTGTPGKITGGISYGGYPRFFKEDRIFTLFGDDPGEYQLVEQRQLGVMEGCGWSLAIGGGRLFYLSRQGPCVYAGGEPALLSAPFGLTRYQNGSGATDDKKYYLNMQDMDGGWHLFVYDLRRGLWMRESSEEMVGLCSFQGEVWACTKKGWMYVLGRPIRYPAAFTEESEVSWYAEFGDIAYDGKNRSWNGYGAQKKRITKLMLRLSTEEGCSARVKLKYDSGDDWQTAAEVTAPTKRSWLLPVIPRRIDHFRLRIEGTGECRICSISIETEGGSER